MKEDARFRAFPRLAARVDCAVLSGRNDRQAKKKAAPEPGIPQDAEMPSLEATLGQWP